MLLKVMSVLIGLGLTFCAWKVSYVAHTGDPALFWGTMWLAIGLGVLAFGLFSAVIMSEPIAAKTPSFVKVPKGRAEL